MDHHFVIGQVQGTAATATLLLMLEAVSHLITPTL